MPESTAKALHAGHRPRILTRTPGAPPVERQIAKMSADDQRLARRFVAPLRKTKPVNALLAQMFAEYLRNVA